MLLAMSGDCASSINAADPAPPQRPAWEIARLFPAQGAWTEEEYLSFTESLNQFCELVDARVEVPDVPDLVVEVVSDDPPSRIGDHEETPSHPGCSRTSP